MKVSGSNPDKPTPNSGEGAAIPEALCKCALMSDPMGGLDDLQRALENESDALFGDRWRKGSRLYWATALAGEVGELCNLVKKEARDGTDLTPQVGDEIADVVITSFLMASVLGLRIEDVVTRKRELIRLREESGSR